MIRRGLISTGLGLSLVFAGDTVWAEPMNLEQAIERASQTDHRVKEREQLVRAAQALLDEAKGNQGLLIGVNAYVGLAPQVDGGFYQDGSSTCTSGCQPRSDAYRIKGLSPWTNLDFTLIKPLYTFGKIEHYSDAARGNIEIKQGDVRLARGKTAMDVSQAYFGYLAARDTRAMLEDVRHRLQSSLDLVKTWLEEGEGEAKQSDLYALETGSAMIDSYLAKARAVENIATEGLRLLTGIPNDQPLELADERLLVLELPALSQAELQKKALENRAEMAQVASGLRARRALVDGKQAESRPNIYAGIVGSFAYTPNREQLDNPFIYDYFNHTVATPVVGMKWDFSMGVQPARVAQAQAELDALVEKAAFARQGIPFEVSEAYYNALALNDAVKSLEQGSHSARRWMVSGYADFEAGLESADKVMTAFQGYVLAYSEYLKTVYDYDMQIARLRLVTGDIK